MAFFPRRFVSICNDKKVDEKRLVVRDEHGTPITYKTTGTPVSGFPKIPESGRKQSTTRTNFSYLYYGRLLERPELRFRVSRGTRNLDGIFRK